MGRLFAFLVVFALPLSGCAIVSATSAVIGATGTLVGATANATAGAINTVAGGGGHKKKADCADKDAAEGCVQPASSK